VDDDKDLASSEEVPVPDERPAWLPGQFEKPEDLAQSYTHSVKKITEQGQELAAMRSQLEEIQAAQQQSQQQSQTADIEQQLYEAYESGDGRAIASANAYLIQQAIAQQAAALTPQQAAVNPEIVAAYAESEVAREYQDWPEYRAKVGEVIAANPSLAKLIEGETSPRVVAEHLKTAYKLAKFESGQTASSRAEQELEELNRRNKNAAQTMTGTNSSQEAESYWDQVKQNSGNLPSFRL